MVPYYEEGLGSNSLVGSHLLFKQPQLFLILSSSPPNLLSKWGSSPSLSTEEARLESGQGRWALRKEVLVFCLNNAFSVDLWSYFYNFVIYFITCDKVAVCMPWEGWRPGIPPESLVVSLLFFTMKKCVLAKTLIVMLMRYSLQHAGAGSVSIKTHGLPHAQLSCTQSALPPLTWTGNVSAVVLPDLQAHFPQSYN